MSYQVLARKWRPKSFEELMGQDHVVTVLTNALMQQRLHHAYLFTGTRGVGKTTIARIFAKSLNCDLGVTAQPCGKCDTCVDIDQGRFVDLLEIDAASRTKVDDTREILDNVQYAPTRGRYKVYLIDEVHMLSRSSFNALLKTLEEPPEHVKFILATTDPQKLPVTVLSRCLQFHLKALTIAQIENQLSIILSAENVNAEPLAVSLLAKAARGSMRDSLSLTDQAIAQGQGNIKASNVQQMLGGVDHHWIFKILIALIKQDSKALMELSLDIASYAPNYGRLMAELIQLLHQVAMAQVVEKHFDLSPEHNQLLEKFCQAMSPEDVQLYYQIVLSGRKDLPYAADEQAAFDMVLLRLLAFKPQKHVLPEEKLETTGVDFSDVEFTEGDNKLTEPADNNQLLSRVEPEDQEKESALNQELLEIEQQAQQTLTSPMVTNEGYVANVEEGTPTESKVQNIEKTSIQSDVNDSNDDISSASMVQQTGEVEAEVYTNFENNEQSLFQPKDNNISAVSTVSEDKVPEAVEEVLTESSLNEPIKEKSPIESILASRNMLRSRKKAMENDGKKPSDANERQAEPAPLIDKEKTKDVPDITTISEQPFEADVIDPSVVKKANQVDRWANMIDSMALNGRLRQLALHAIIDPASNDEQLILQLNQSTKHLKSEVAHQQLEQFVSEYFERNMSVELNVVDETVDDPFQIQEQINDKRYDYAKELLVNDSLVIALQNEFQAQLDEKTIVAR